MNLRFALAAALGCAMPWGAWCQQPADLKPATDRLAATIYTGPSMVTLEELSDGIGGRLTGSPAYVRSTEWAVAKFKSYGIENVKLEPFTMEAGWQRGSASGMMLTPLSRPLNVASLGWASSTPAGGVQGNVVLVNDITPEVLQAQEGRRSVQGNIDPQWLLLPPAELEARLHALFARLLQQPHELRSGWVCGLGHGVLQTTPESNVKLALKLQREMFG